MRLSKIAGFVLASASVMALAQGVGTPPTAKKVHTERSLNGGTLVDDYGWLRDRKNPEVVALLEAENAYAAKVMAPMQPLADAVYKETLSHLKETDDSVPYRKGGYFYYTRTETGKQYVIVCRKKGSLSAPEEVMLDLNQMAVGQKFMGLGSTVVSDDGNLLAYTTDVVGFRQYTLHVKDLRTGKLLPDTTERVDEVEWAADNKTLFYVTEDATTKRGDKLHRHVLGSDVSKDPVVYSEKDERYDVGVARTRDGKYLLMPSESHVTAETRFVSADTPTAVWKVIEPRKEGLRYYVDEGGGLFYIRVDDTGKTFRLVTAPVATPEKANWKEIVASRTDVPLEDQDVFKSFYVLTERVNGLPVLRVVPLDGGQRRRCRCARRLIRRI